MSLALACKKAPLSTGCLTALLEGMYSDSGNQRSFVDPRGLPGKLPSGSSAFNPYSGGTVELPGRPHDADERASLPSYALIFIKDLPAFRSCLKSYRVPVWYFRKRWRNYMSNAGRKKEMCGEGKQDGPFLFLFTAV